MTESITLRLEILKMARELVINEYIDRRAQDHNLWVAQSDELMRTRGFKLQYPAFPPYPTESDIIAKADSLVKFMSAPVPEPQASAIVQPTSNIITSTIMQELAPIVEVPTKEAEVTEITPTTVVVAVESMPIIPVVETNINDQLENIAPADETHQAAIMKIFNPTEVPPIEVALAEVPPIEVALAEAALAEAAPVDAVTEKTMPEIAVSQAVVIKDVKSYQNSIMKIFQTESAPTEVAPQPAPPTGDEAIMKIFQTDVTPANILPVEKPDPSREYEPPKPPSSLAASILPSWIMRNNR